MPKSRRQRLGDSAASVYKARWLVRILVLATVGVALLFSVLFFEDPIDAALGVMRAHEVVTVGDDLNVHFIDVGQGDACVIEFPDGKTMLIDAGEDTAEVRAAVLGYIDTNIRKNGERIDYFDYVILTHPDSDHCGSLPAVLNKYPAKTFYRPNVQSVYPGFIDPGAAFLYEQHGEKDTEAYRAAIEAGHAADEVIINFWTLDPIVPDDIAKGEKNYYSFNFYGPTEYTYANSNDYSPVMLLEYAGERVLLSGDAERAGEVKFVDSALKREGKYAVFTQTLYCGVIKAGHHGSNTSSSRAFLEAFSTPNSVRKTYVVFSCGSKSQYGHPADGTVSRLKEMGFKENKLLSTHEIGHIVATIKLDRKSGDMRLFVNETLVPTPMHDFLWRYIAAALFGAFCVGVIVPPVVVIVLCNRKKAE